VGLNSDRSPATTWKHARAAFWGVVIFSAAKESCKLLWNAGLEAPVDAIATASAANAAPAVRNAVVGRGARSDDGRRHSTGGFVNKEQEIARMCVDACLIAALDMGGGIAPM
jgi:hypothetical protein